MKPKYIQSEYNAIDGLTNTPIMSKVISSFPYPQRFCPYCEQELTIANAIHVTDNEELFKCIYQCYNLECDSYDDLEDMAYLRVYYSCDEALKCLETIFLKVKRERRNGE
jgi:hypothetical protein